ncbi:MAG TPA: serine/threonine-protein kinase, partial [Gemmataceae bacterium]|nr:serine/threonine-protein kinase [Gemmataceae bacterium]
MNRSPSRPAADPCPRPPDPGPPVPRTTGRAPRLDELTADQSRRWALGDRRSVESYVADHPDLADDTERLLALINGEVLRRGELGEAPRLDEYLGRFPAQADRLRALFAVIERCREPTTVPGRDGGPDEEVPPSRLDRYRVLARLGAGGFGTVYLCEDEELGRRVALKVPHRSAVGSAGEAEAYLTEARALALLDHPGIVPIYDVGRTPDGLCYFVSKYVEGGSLEGRLSPGRLTPAEAAALAADVAEALHHAHGRGLVHRDVKPANILLAHGPEGTAGHCYLCDFGLIK